MLLKRVFSTVMFILLLTSMLTLALNIQPVRAQRTIYIRADGSIQPSTAPISTSDNVTYTLTDNIYDSIVVERSNIIVDGAGYKVEGTEALGSKGIYLSGVSNVTIENVNIKHFSYGIHLDGSSNDQISGNNITNNYYGIWLNYSSHNNIYGNNITTNNYYGIWLDWSSYNSISGNNITTNNIYGIYLSESSYNSISENNISENNITTDSLDGINLYRSSYNIVSGNNITTNNRDGIDLDSSSNNNIISGNNITTNNRSGIGLFESSNNTFYHNNFINNTKQVYDYSWDYWWLESSVNVWDNGYPSGGNYWSDYNGSDSYYGTYQNETGSDGMGDSPYVIDANNIDHYPLKPYAPLFGDVNHDGKVNLKDVMMAVQAFNSFPGQPRWNIAADIDNSGRVDMRDIVIIVLHFNKHE